MKLTKVAIIKLGGKKTSSSGKKIPEKFEKIQIKLPTKFQEGKKQENYIPHPAYPPEGVDSLRAILPFDDIDLIFDVGYVGFPQFREWGRCMMKSKGVGKPYKIISLSGGGVLQEGILQENMISQYRLEYVGYLQVMVPGHAGLGEAFVYKTQSSNAIRTIKEELELLSKLTGGKLMGLPVVLRATRKDGKIKSQSGSMIDTAVTYLSVSYDPPKGKSLLGSIAAFLKEREDVDKVLRIDKYESYTKGVDIADEEISESAPSEKFKSPQNSVPANINSRLQEGVSSLVNSNIPRSAAQKLAELVLAGKMPIEEFEAFISKGPAMMEVSMKIGEYA